jgi:predicted aspartyl protease
VEYQQTYQPPFPVLPVRLEMEGQSSEPIPALLDTGADITFVPTHLLEEIGAAESEPARIRSHFGESHEVQLYLVGLQVDNLALPGVYVVGDDSGSDIILGRDILNKLSVLLDGPAQRAEILPESALARLRGRR